MNKNLLKRIDVLSGVGPKRIEGFNKLGINSLMDLIKYYPRDYQDRRNIKKITDIEVDEMASVSGYITSMEFRRIRKGLSILKIYISDGFGVMECIWFNQDFIKKNLNKDTEYWFYGRVGENGGKLSFASPFFTSNYDEFNIIEPVYSLTKDISQNIIRKNVKNLLNYLDEIEDLLDKKIIDKHKLVDLKFALKNIHFPMDNEAFFQARRRLVFEELFNLQLNLLKIKSVNTAIQNNVFITTTNNTIKFINSLPFKITNAQEKVINEILLDFKEDKVMNRLIQGDVGSGKTVVAESAIVAIAENGFQSAFMAPTEILAKQHYMSLTKDLEDLKVGLLVGSLKAKDKRETLEKIENGYYDVIVGTHALIQKEVIFKKLGFVITDEQHRFGVDQRSILSKKGINPHVLVMSATPIPRTLALILYGDLDISIIDEMPKGRIPIETYEVDDSKRRRIYQFINKNIENGNQAFIVCPSIEESEKMELKSVVTVYKELSKVFSNRNVGMIHGKMKTFEKDILMESFKIGEIDILVSTTVIEVGVDIPNATIMVIEDANRFGLAQLHQLRGRVGRSNMKSYCVLFNNSKSTLSKSRMKVMTDSSDGFYISEQDLILRGPGDFFGTRQHGVLELKIANLYTDMDILKEAQLSAAEFMKENNIINYEKIEI